VDEFLRDVLAELGLSAVEVVPLKESPDGNSSWTVVRGDGSRVALRRYHETATVDDVAYEHQLLARLDQIGWVVPHAVTPLVAIHGRLYCGTRYVPGQARLAPTAAEQARRGRDLAHLQFAMRPLTSELGQRPGWRPQHTATTVLANVDWDLCLRLFSERDQRLATWANAAANATAAALHELGAAELPVTMIHGDFAEWNVHYGTDGALTGVVDFGLAHIDSRPYELAIARTYRAPEVIAAYRNELREVGWPLSDLEEAAIPLLHHAFRVDMVAWEIDLGRRKGTYDLAMIERQLARTGVPAP
jgi:homoserine kinase type II